MGLASTHAVWGPVVLPMLLVAQVAVRARGGGAVARHGRLGRGEGGESGGREAAAAASQSVAARVLHSRGRAGRCSLDASGDGWMLAVPLALAMCRREQASERGAPRVRGPANGPGGAGGFGILGMWQAPPAPSGRCPFRKARSAYSKRGEAAVAKPPERFSGPQHLDSVLLLVSYLDGFARSRLALLHAAQAATCMVLAYYVHDSTAPRLLRLLRLLLAADLLYNLPSAASPSPFPPPPHMLNAKALPIPFRSRTSAPRSREREAHLLCSIRLAGSPLSPSRPSHGQHSTLTVHGVSTATAWASPSGPTYLQTT